MKKPFSLSKNERLKSKKDIDTLFLLGKAYFVFPFKVFYRIGEPVSIAQLRFGISVPKKVFKRAVDRNVTKRRVREVYRVHKLKLQEAVSSNKNSLHVMLVYTHNELMAYNEIANILPLVLQKLHLKYQKGIN